MEFTLTHFYTEDLEKRKTVSSKKAFLTRQRKALEEHLNDLKESKSGWLHGERVTKIRIWKVEVELKVIAKFRKELESCK